MPLTAGEIAEYQAVLNEVNRLAQGDLVAIWRATQGMTRREAIEFILDALPEVAELYRGMSVEAAAAFYATTQELSFSDADIVRASSLNREAFQASVGSQLRGAGNAAHLALVGGVLQRYVFNSARTFAMDGFDRGGQGWYRAASAGACQFCRMLATRAVREWGPYGSAASASVVGVGKHSDPVAREKGDSYHDNCRCVPVLASAYEVPSYVEAWDADYEAAATLVGSRSSMNQILAAMRQVSGHSH